MSIPVDVADLAPQLERFGPRALLVTVRADSTPHVASVIVTLDGDLLTMPAGRTAHANAIERPTVTIIWLTGTETEFGLIVDGQARAPRGGTLVVHPTSAVLHKLARRPEPDRH